MSDVAPDAPRSRFRKVQVLSRQRSAGRGFLTNFDWAWLPVLRLLTEASGPLQALFHLYVTLSLSEFYIRATLDGCTDIY